MSGVRRRVVLALLWLGYVILLLQAAGFVYFRLGLFTPVGGYAYPKGLHVPDAQVQFRLRPGFRGHFRGNAYGEIPLRTNEHGYRDGSFGEKSPDRRRVVVLGDSVVFGSGILEEDRFTEQLERHPDLEARRIDILNLGVNRYGFEHYLVLAEVDVPGLDPDAVIVGFTLNDIRHIAPTAWVRGLGKQQHDEAEPMTVRRYLLRQTYAGRLLRELRDRIEIALLSADEEEEYHTAWMRTVVDRWNEEDDVERLDRLLAQFNATMRANALPFGIVIFPELNDVLDPERFSGPRRRLIGMLEKHGIAFCDLTPAFAVQEDPGAFYLPRDSVHFTAEGHRIVRDAVLACAAEGRLPLLAARESGPAS